MSYGIIDLEFTAWKGSQERSWCFNWEHTEIIQIGVIKFKNFDSKKIISKKLYVKPLKNKILSFYISKLTHINQKQINDYGLNFLQSVKELERFFSGVKKIYCNGLDKKILIKNFKYNSINNNTYQFLKKIFNIKVLLKKNSDINLQDLKTSGALKLKKNNKKLKKHDALSDAIKIFLFLKENQDKFYL